MSKAVVQAAWDDVPHLSQKAKDELYATIPAYQRDARTKGIPQLGSGAIYPVPESDIIVADFELPAHFPRSYALDVGWNRTAALWGARDNESGIVYLYSEYYRSQAEPVIHAQAIKSRGDWIPGVIDPASRGRSQFDGLKLIQTYRELGLILTESKNAVEAGIYEVWQMLANGKLKVFRSLVNWLMEFRIYQRDEKGRVVKSNDHLMDCTRYLILSGLGVMMQKPAGQSYPPRQPRGGWLGV
jgi:hypothetical protein